MCVLRFWMMFTVHDVYYFLSMWDGGKCMIKWWNVFDAEGERKGRGWKKTRERKEELAIYFAKPKLT